MAIPTQFLGPGGPMVALRFLARDRQLGVLVTPESVSIETTRYERYEEFRERVQQVLLALEGVEPAIPGIKRIGLRYVDEVRIGKRLSVNADWGKYVEPKLVGPLTLRLGTALPQRLQGALEYDLGDGKHIAIRFGSLKGRAVGDAPLRRRPSTEDGPFFLVDIDSFWTGKEPLVEFSATAALQTCDQLHDPARSLFDAVITDRLRDEVLRSARHGH